MKETAPKHRVAFYLPMSSQHLRTELFYRGVVQYAHSVGGWRFGLFADLMPTLALAWEPDGIIADVKDQTAASQLAAWGGPVVDVGGRVHAEFTRVGFDEMAVGKLAAEYFLDRGFRCFGVAPTCDSAQHQARAEGFVNRLKKVGLDASIAPTALFAIFARRDGPRDRDQDEWLSALRGGAVFATSDGGAFGLLESARSIGLRVPADLAVLGAQDDRIYCHLTDPALSSVRCPELALGRAAGSALDRLLRGEQRADTIALPPIGIISRGSTDAYAVADNDLGAALAFIRDHAGDRIGVNDVVTASGLSASTLQRRMKAALGRSPLEELVRVRVELARQLLTDTTLAIAEVARRSGFLKSSQLSEAFGRRMGCTPSEYRGQHLGSAHRSAD